MRAPFCFETNQRERGGKQINQTAMVQSFKLKQTTVKLVEILFQHHIGCWIFIDRLMLFFRTILIFIVPCTISNVEDFKSVGKCLVIHIEFLCAVSFQES